MGNSEWRSLQRLAENQAALRALVDAGSPRVVRDPVEGRRIAVGRRVFPGIGDRSGHLAVTGYLAGKLRGVSAVIVRCDCGQPEYTVEANNLAHGYSTRCNACAKKAAGQKRYWKYVEAMPEDAHRRRLLDRLSAAIGRCHNPNDAAYRSYGGRGIYVCDEWRRDRSAFLRHVRTLDGWDRPELDMDRTDVDRGYEPGNVRFVSRRDNALNKRRVSDLQERVAELERELAGLRRAELRPEEPVHSVD